MGVKRGYFFRKKEGNKARSAPWTQGGIDGPARAHVKIVACKRSIVKLPSPSREHHSSEKRR